MIWRKRAVNLMAVLIFCLGLGLLGLYLQHPWPFGLALLLLVLSLLSRWFGRRLARPILRLAEIITFLVVRFLLALFYLFIMLPWSLFYRAGLAAQDLQHRKRHSMFNERNHDFGAADFKRNF